MDSREQQMEHGAAVARFLHDPTIRAIFSEMEKLYFKQWTNTDDREERDTLWAKARALQDIGVSLQAVVDSGTLAAAQEEQARKDQ